MKTTKTTKSPKTSKSDKKFFATRFSVRRVFKVAGLCALVLFVAVQLAFDLQVIRNQNNDSSTAVFALIGQAVDDLNKPAVVDPVSGAVYLTDAKLKLPPVQNLPTQILYNYSNFDNGVDAQLHITTQQAVGTAKSRILSAQTGGTIMTSDSVIQAFKQVPRLQACARGITVLFSAQTAADYRVEPENITQLKDGRTVYIVTDDVAKCGNGTLTSLVDYVRQAESY